MISAAKILLKLGAKNILIKGGHAKSNKIEDVFFNRKNIKIFKSKRIKTKNTLVLVAHYLVQLLLLYHVENL